MVLSDGEPDGTKLGRMGKGIAQLGFPYCQPRDSGQRELLEKLPYSFYKTPQGIAVSEHRRDREPEENRPD